MSEIIRKSSSLYEKMNKCTSLKDVSAGTKEQIWTLGLIRRYEKGEAILRAKEEFCNIYFLLSGKVIQYNLTHLGKRKILFVLGEGALLNDHVFDGHAASIFCEPVEKCVVLEIPKEELLRLMDRDFSLVRGIMGDQERKMWRLFHQLKNTVGSIYMERKLAAKLWKLARDFGIRKRDGIEIDMNISVTFLADMLGAPRETASRLCRELIRQGLIRIEKKRVTVSDPERLVSFYKTGKLG